MGVVKVLKPTEKLDLASTLEELKKSSENIGCIVAFIGVVRGIGRNGSKVKRLEYEVYEKVAEKKMMEIAEDAERKQGVKRVDIYHYEGKREVGEDIVYVFVAADHRENAFKTLIKVVDSVKKEVPIWKKEVTEKGEYWVEE